LGSVERAYTLITNAVGQRISGVAKGDWSGIRLENPADTDISGSVSITFDEYGASGAYKWNVALPSGGPEGKYTLVATDPFGYIHKFVLLAYGTLQGDTGDSTAEMDLWIFDENQNPKSGATLGDLGISIWSPSGSDLYGSLSESLVELAPGHYTLKADVSVEQGEWFFDVTHPTWWIDGSLGTWLYLPAAYEVASAPALTGATNDGTGTSATLSYVAADPADTIYTYYRLHMGGDWTLSGDTRIGSGDVSITGMLDSNMYDFIGVASQSGSAIINQSPPSNLRSVWVDDGSTLFAGIMETLWDLVDAMTPGTVTTIWGRPNAPRPSGPFVTMIMRPLDGAELDHHGAPDASGIRTIYADRAFTLSVEVYGTRSATGEDPAHSHIEGIKRSFQTEAVSDTLGEASLAFRQAGPTQDLSAVGRIDFEARYLSELEFGLTQDYEEDAGFIATSDAPTGSYQ
jgi:hypothetical protein